MNNTSLDKLDINKCAKIHSLNCNGDLRRRLLDLGLVNGTNITAVLKSPTGNPIALSLIHISEPTRRDGASRMPSSA